MWKCQYCDKMSTDDLKICPHCNAPNPAAIKTGSSQARGSAGQYGVGSYAYGNTDPTVAAYDPHGPYSPNNAVNQTPKKKGSRALLWIGLAITAVVVLTVVFSLPEWKKESSITFKEPEAGENTSLHASVQAAVPKTGSGVSGDTTAPEPVSEPFSVQAPASLYLDFGETYLCNLNDFVLPHPLDAGEIIWSCGENENGTTCTPDGSIIAGNIQIDLEQGFNEAVYVTGTAKDGSTLTYEVITGDGTTYITSWSNSARSMRGFLSGYTIVADKMIPNCSGFSLYYEYSLTRGKLDANAWSVWVREGGTTWVRVQDVNITDPSGELFSITFDHPISFNEIWIMPETYSPEFSFTSSYYIGYLSFE